MNKINFQDGTKVSSAKVTIDEVDYPVTPARYTGATPLSANVMNTMQTNIENAINQNVDNIGGEDYDNTATYEEGDIVKYQGQLYICIEAIDTPEEWDSTKWNATDVLSSAGGNEVTIGAPEDVTGKTKIFINEEEGTDAYSEVVNSLAGNEIAKAPSVHAVNEGLSSIIESGENNNGTYIKYADGTLICTIRKEINVVISQAWGSLYIGENFVYDNTNVPIQFTFPVAFVENPEVNYSISGGNSALVMPWINSTTPLTTTDRLALVRGNSSTSQTYTINITAIGRWK